VRVTARCAAARKRRYLERYSASEFLSPSLIRARINARTNAHERAYQRDSSCARDAREAPLLRLVEGREMSASFVTRSYDVSKFAASVGRRRKEEKNEETDTVSSSCLLLSSSTRPVLDFGNPVIRVSLRFPKANARFDGKQGGAKRPGRNIHLAFFPALMHRDQ